jgi:hypothetical protein
MWASAATRVSRFRTDCVRHGNPAKKAIVAGDKNF